MRKVVKKKTKKFIAVVVAAAMVLASGVAVPVKAASDVTEGKAVEALPTIELDKPVTVTKENHQFKFTADEYGCYQFSISGGEGCEAYLINSYNWETYLEDGTGINDGFEQSTKYDMSKGGVVYVDCQLKNENYTLTVTCLETYKIHGWEDVKNVDFYALRDVYAGIDDVFSGLGATFTFNDGTTFEYDGLYNWSRDNYEEYMTESTLISDGWGGKWDSASNSVELDFGYNISIIASGPLKETSDQHWNCELSGPGELCLKMKNRFESNCPVNIDDTVKIQVVESPVESIEPFGATTMINANGWVEDVGYTLYHPYISGIKVTYNDGTKDVLTVSSGQRDEGIKDSQYVSTSPTDHEDHLVNRNRVDLISNQGSAHWEKGGTYPVTVTYMGAETKFQCTVGDQYTFDEQDLCGCNIRLKNEKLFLGHIDEDSLVEEVTKKDVLLVPGEDYEILGWYQITGSASQGNAHYRKLSGLPTELGRYRLALLGKGQYKGAAICDDIEVTDIKDLTAYQAYGKNIITASSAKETKAGDFEVYYNVSDEERIILTPDTDYSFDGWYKEEYDEETGYYKYTEVSELVGGEKTYRAKLTGKGSYTGTMYVSVRIWKDEELEVEPTQSPTPTMEPAQTPDISGGSTSGSSSSSETTPTAAPTITPVPSQTPGAASGPAVSTGPAITPGEDTKPTEPTAAPETSDEPSTQTPTPSEPTQAPDNNDDDEKNEPQATTATVNKSGVKATVKTTENGTAAVKNVKSNKKSVTVSSTVEVEGVEYKVTVIEANAFANCKKATKITLPSTVKKIKKKAFTGAKKVKTIIVKSKKAVTVKKGAFKGINTEKITIKASKMSKKQLKKFKKILKKAGFKGKIKK